MNRGYMETIGRTGDSPLDPLDPLQGGHVTASASEAAVRPSWLAQQSVASRSAIAGALIGALVLAVLFDKVRSTIITVVVAVAACAAIWIGANLLFDQARNRLQRFNTLWFGTLGALLGVLLHGNGLTLGSEGGTLAWVVGPLLGGVAFGAIGFLLAGTDDPDAAAHHLDRRLRHHRCGDRFVAPGGVLPRRRLADHGRLHRGRRSARRRTERPRRDDPRRHGALVGAGIGWVLGYWGGADVGDGTIATSVLGAAVPGILLGLRLSGTTNPDLTRRAEIDRASRPWIFLGPAVLFILVMLVIPAIRTAILSLFDRDSEEFVGLENYQATFTDKASWDLSSWTNMFTSTPFFIGVILLVIAILVGARAKRQTGHAVELGNPTVAPLVVGVLFVCFAAFTAMRGTIINNLWWVVTVTFFSTCIGLAVAVLADQRGGERIAKSIIFMPVALSLVGASIIWRFMYQTREISKQQTGVLNALWVALGRLSTGSGLPTLIVAILLVVLLAVIGTFLARSLARRAYGRAVVPGVLMLFAAGSSCATPRSSAAASAGSPTPRTARSARDDRASCRRAPTTTSG